MTYIDTKGVPSAQNPSIWLAEPHSWADFTAARLEWLYGPGRADTPPARADVENWNRLGRKVAA